MKPRTIVVTGIVHTWLDRGGPKGDLIELKGRTSHRCSAATAPAPAAPAPAALTTGIMTDT